MYYIGDGSHYWPGVPMRDLSVEEWALLDKMVQDALIAAKLFVTVAPATTPAAASAEQAPAAKRKPASGG